VREKYCSLTEKVRFISHTSRRLLSGRLRHVCRLQLLAPCLFHVPFFTSHKSPRLAKLLGNVHSRWFGRFRPLLGSTNQSACSSFYSGSRQLFQSSMQCMELVVPYMHVTGHVAGQWTPRRRMSCWCQRDIISLPGQARARQADHAVVSAACTWKRWVARGGRDRDSWG